MNRSILFLSAFSLFALSQITGDTPAEKQFAYPFSKKHEAKMDVALTEVNEKLFALRAHLKSCYAEASLLKEKKAEEKDYQTLLHTVKSLKASMQELENKWKEIATDECKKEEEGYSFWDQDETTLGQLVTEYGALDFLYIVPPEMTALKLHMHSNLPIPRESWSEVLEIILSHNGVGAKTLNTYAKQLYLLKQDPSFIQAIISKPEELLLLPSQTRLFYMFSPSPEQAKSTFQFFERFADAKQTFVHQVGTKIALVSSKEEIEKLINLHKMVWQDSMGKTSRVVPIVKMPVKEMEKILLSFFGDSIEKNRPPFNKVEQEGLTVFPLGHGNSLVLIGQEEVVDRAEKIVKETEEQLQNPAEMTVQLY